MPSENSLTKSKTILNKFKESKKIYYEYYQKIKDTFITEKSTDIDLDLIISCTKFRWDGFSKLCKCIKHNDIAYKIELGIFEFTLVYVMMNNIEKKIIRAIYQSKIDDIIGNLDVENKHINNQTLYYSVISKYIDGQLIAFLSPEQLHPKKWEVLLKKRQLRFDKERSLATTNIYKCRRCGCNKCTVSMMQTRSADEPMTIFVTCTECYTTFKK